MYNSMSNEELINLIRKGDKKAYDEIIKKNEGIAVKVAMNNIKRYKSDREETISEAMYYLVRAVNRYDDKSGVLFSTFAWTTIHNGLNNYNVTNNRDMRNDKDNLITDNGVYLKGEYNGDIFDFTKSDVNLEKVIESKELKDILLEGINKLNKFQKEVILLYYYQQKTFAEIGEMYNKFPQHIVRVKNKALSRLVNILPKNIKEYLV